MPTIDLTREVSSIDISPWEVSDADILDIPELQLDVARYAGHVARGTQRELEPPYSTMGTDGLIKGTGLVVFEPRTLKMTVGHLLPDGASKQGIPPEENASLFLKGQEPRVRKELS